MAQITNKLVHFNNKTDFDSRIGDIRDDSIVFVKDATIIQTHQQPYYCGSGPVALKSDLANYATTSALTSGLASKANTSHTHTISQISGLQGELDSKLESVSLADLGVTATTTELNYVDGVTSNIQTQLNGKAASSHTHNTDNITLLTGYTEGSSTTALNTSMTLNEALASLQNQIQERATTTTLEDYALKTEVPDTSSFATKTELSEYLPLTGGTLTGSLFFNDEQNAGIILSSGIGIISTNSGNDALMFIGGSHILGLDSSNGFILDSSKILTEANWDEYITNFATKTELAGYLPLTGGTMAGNIDMQDANISFTGGAISGVADIYGDGDLTIKANQSISSGTLTFKAAQSMVTLSQAGLESTVNITAPKFNSTNGFYETSDARFKNFHFDVKALKVIDEIPTKYYNWKTDLEETPVRIGTSAQEIQKLYPDLVSENEEGILSVDYARLSIIAIAAIKELKAEINELKSKLN